VVARYVPPGDAYYVHSQNMSSTLWTVNHNLGKIPAVTLTDSSGRKFDAQIDHANANTFTVTLTYPTGGKAYCS
jgi:hypothetical protein